MWFEAKDHGASCRVQLKSQFLEMKNLVLALLVAAAFSGQSFAREGATSASAAYGFSLLPAEKCNEARDVRQCLAARPKAWSADERRLIQEAMRRLTAHELVQGLLVGAQENGYSGLQRYSTYAKQDATHGPTPTFSPGFVLYISKVIGLTDAFFQTESVRDPISDYRFGDLTLVHELVHAFDDRQKSAEPGFRSVTGWAFKNNRWAYVNRVDYSEYLGVYANTLTLYASGRYGEARTRDRSFATSMRFPLPTIQSLARPDECFADILAHLIIDSRASTYLQPEVVEWFERNVFPALIENARRFKAADYELF
jgi:hypothetical protein